MIWAYPALVGLCSYQAKLQQNLMYLAAIADAQPQAVQSSSQVLLYKREHWLTFMTLIWIFLQVLHVNLEYKRRVYWFILLFRQAFSANICQCCWHDTYASCGFQYLKFCQICSQFTFSFLPSQQAWLTDVESEPHRLPQHHQCNNNTCSSSNSWWAKGHQSHNICNKTNRSHLTCHSIPIIANKE